MADLRKLLDILNESSTTAGSVATFAAGLSGTHKRVEEDKPEAPSVLEYGNWENSALTTSSKLKKERKKAARVVKSIYGEDSVEEAANSKQQAAIAVAKKKEVGESKVVNRKTILEYASTPIRSKKDYLAKRKALQDLQISGTTADKKLIMQKRAELERQAKQLGFVLGEDGVAEGPVDTVKKGIKHIKRVATGKDLDSRIGQEITKSHQAVMRGDYATSKKHFDRYDKLDKLANKEQGVAEGSEQKMSVQNTLAYLKKVMGTESHEDWRNHIINTNEYFVLKDIPVNSLRSDLSGLDKANVEKYKQMDFSKAPPIVIGSDGNILDGYHRVNVAKALKVPTLKAWVGVKKQGVAEGYDDRKTAPGWHSDSVKNPNFNDELSIRRISPPGKRLKSGKLSADERGSQERTKALMKFKKAQGGLTGPKGVLPEEGVAEGSVKKDMTGQTCEKCKKDKYQERSWNDDRDGTLRCSCGHVVDRWRKYKKKDGKQGVAESSGDKVHLKTPKHGLADHPGRNTGVGLRTFSQTPEQDRCPKCNSLFKNHYKQGVAEGYDDEDEGNPVMNAIINRIMRTRPDLLLNNDLEKLQAAIRDVALGVGDVDEIGSSDISCWVKQVEQNLQQGVGGMGIPASSQHGKKSMAEPVDGKLDEADLIINPASISRKPIGLIKKVDHTDHEVEMAKSDLYQASKNALAVFQMIKDVPEEVGIEGWVQEKIIKANDYLNTVREYLEGKELESMDGVAASTKMFTSEGEMEEGKTGPGLWANIHAKRERIKAGSGERMRKPGSKGAPKASDFRAAAGKK